MQQISEAYSAIMSKDAEQLRAVMVTFADQKKAAAAAKAAKDPDARRVLTMAEMEPVRKRVEQRLAPLIEGDKIGMALTPRGLIISLRESGFFAPGQATFLPGAAGLLSEVGAVVAELPNQPVRMEGHTDNAPIQTARFPSNWELSTARAIAVLDLMVEQYHVDPHRVSVAGYGERRPIAGNLTPQDRAKNRRVDIAILSRSAAEMAPKQRLDMPASNVPTNDVPASDPPVAALPQPLARAAEPASGI
jgi:flagellar motor protein MotB